MRAECAVRAWAPPRKRPAVSCHMPPLVSVLVCSYTAPRSAKKKRIFTSLTQLMHQQAEQAAAAADGQAAEQAAAAGTAP